jgi:hypothetical protein
MDPSYHVVHSSIVPCNANFLQALRGKAAAETTGEDNVKTLRLVFAAYDSAVVEMQCIWTDLTQNMDKEWQAGKNR